MDPLSKNILTQLLPLPTMSFHEEAVATFVRFYAAGLGLKVKEDRAGNILVAYRGRKGPAVTLAAHMDHPGFEVISSKGKDGIVALWGRIEPDYFDGSDVVIHTSNGIVRGKICGGVKGRKYSWRPCFRLIADASISRGDFGCFDLPGIRFAGDRILTRSADDLVGVAAILEALTRLVTTRAKASMSGLFTRAEESGFLGAFAAMESGLIPKKDPLIAVECSSAPGGKVDIGGGPVIRAGDKQSTYDPAVDVWLSDTAERIGGRRNKFKYQRALLAGGRCESCIYIVHGYRAGGLALPLGNYHNHGPSGPAPEYVSAKDYSNLVDFMIELARNPMPSDMLRKKIELTRIRYRSRRKKLFRTK